MNKIKSIQEDIFKKQREINAITQLEADWPGELPEPDLLAWQNSSLCEFSVIYKAQKLEDAKALVNIWGDYILPLNMTKGSFTSFITDQHKDEKNIKSKEPVFPVLVSVSTYSTKFEFYAMVNGHLVSIDIEEPFRVSWDITRVGYTTKISYGEKYVDKCWLETPGLRDTKHIKWGTGGRDYPNSFTAYFTPDRDFDSIFAKTENE